MSNWVHVAGVVRIDDIRVLYEESEVPDFDKIFGKECRYEDGDFDDMYKHPKKYLPHGSEGTLRKSVWINPKESHLASYTVTIFGDLRDVDCPDKIVEWFKKKCKKLWVRDAVITAREDWCGRVVTWVYENKD